MWFVIIRYREGTFDLDGPYPDKERARVSMMKLALPDGPEYGLAYVQEFGRIETMHTWKKVEEVACRS